MVSCDFQQTKDPPYIIISQVFKNICKLKKKNVLDILVHMIV